MLSTGDFKKGKVFEDEGVPWQILDVTTQSPSARGAATLVKAKCRNILTGQVLLKTYKSGEKFKEPDIEMRNAQYLYREGDGFLFMDQESYDQLELSAELVGDGANFMKENMEIRLVFFNGNAVAIELPHVVELVIVQCDPGVRGDTVTAATKAAKLETGFSVQVPLFVEQGTMVRVDTRDGRYLERA